jgi:antitoxin HigA-1
MAFERRQPSGWAVHPGEILEQEFLKAASMSQYALAKEIGVPSQAINDIVRQKRGLSADMAMRLGKFWNTTPEFWLNLQIAYDLCKVGKQARRKIEKIQPYRAA